MDDLGFLENCSYLIHDRDTKFTDSGLRAIATTGLQTQLDSLEQCSADALQALGDWFPEVTAGRVLCELSSVATNAHMVFGLCGSGKLEPRPANEAYRRNARELLDGIWSQQSADGSFPKYPGGPPSGLAMIQAFLAAKMVGPPNAAESMSADFDQRLLQLARFINEHRLVRKTPLAIPAYVLFGLVSRSHLGGIGSLVPQVVLESALDWWIDRDATLPWTKHVVIPLLYLITSNQHYRLRPDQVPHEIGLKQHPAGTPHHRCDTRFKEWLDRKTSRVDGMLFDYTTTTVFGVVARHIVDPADEEGLTCLALKTMTHLQTNRISDGPRVEKWQSDSDTAIGDAFALLSALTDSGKADCELAERAARFILSRQMDSGGFGFSLNNCSNPDLDDTGTAIWSLKRWADGCEALPQGMERESIDSTCRKGLDYLLAMQNADHGWGTWNKDHYPRLSWLNRTRVVDARSVLEHTEARFSGRDKSSGTSRRVCSDCPSQGEWSSSEGTASQAP